MNESQGQFIVGLLFALVAQGVLREANRCWREKPGDPWYWWSGAAHMLGALLLFIAAGANVLGAMQGGGR